MNANTHPATPEPQGKLRIYFGAVNGVGKTYAMLNAARQKLALGRKVLVHLAASQPADVITLQTELQSLAAPDSMLLCHGEFDLAAALDFKPELLLIDELAHSNVAGDSHVMQNATRWQDVRDMLAAGTDVYTTVNVQDLEGLHGAVIAITKVAQTLTKTPTQTLTQTIPDSVFDNADEVILLDVPVDELIARFEHGKLRRTGVDVTEPLYRKGHLMALRNLAIRRNADRIKGEGQVSKPEPVTRKRQGVSRVEYFMPAARTLTRQPYLRAAAISLLTVLVVWPWQSYIEPANTALILLFFVMAVAMRMGRGPAVLASVLMTLCFDFFFVEPRFSFWINDWQYALTMGLILLLGGMAAKLISDVSAQSRVAEYRALRASAINEFARALSAALQTEQISDICRNFIEDAFQARASLLLPDAGGRLQYPAEFGPEYGNALNMSALDMQLAQAAFERAELTGPGTAHEAAASILYLPLVAPMRTRGVLVVQASDSKWMHITEQRKHLDTFATLVAIALERVHYVEVAQDALVTMESERLRNSLLSALSHDLRTPLTSLVGLSETLTLTKPDLSSQQHELALALRDEALRMNRLVNNLLDMARMESGQVRLNLQWQAIQEVVGSAVRACKFSLSRHQLQVCMGNAIPLVQYDALLLERVLCNLLENAGKYTPPGTMITIAAECSDDMLVVSVSDNGPGLPAGKEEAIFEKFTRGERESAQPGMGLGLSICRAVIAAHGGKICARPASQGGACFEFRLPLGDLQDIGALDEMEME
ncbi:ATP-binding protein [Undibacterium sp. Ji49W]|uniref:ATP-binding protein n=1 Tax=Undibacterium sp. Ji49W TaxID=3413040 RepID=UPI003BF2DD7A